MFDKFEMPNIQRAVWRNGGSNSAERAERTRTTVARRTLVEVAAAPNRLLIFPDEGHWVLKPQNAVLWQREFFGWLDRWLK